MIIIGRCPTPSPHFLKKVDKNFKLSNALRSITRVPMAKALCRVWDRVPPERLCNRPDGVTLLKDNFLMA
jgi:hypothetical protein